jgi:hypothetical protein
MRGVRGLGGFVVAALAGAVLAATGCTSTPPPVAAHNLERPSDIAFACVGLLPIQSDGTVGAPGDTSGTPTVSGLPMDQCNVPGQFDPLFNTTRRTFAFVANSARGELSVLDLNNSKLIDLDLANPETNVAPLGVLPEQMSASSDGCRIVTANRGSCDLTLVDIGTLMTPQLAVEGKVTVASTGPSTVSQEIVVRAGHSGKPLRLNPQEIKFLPQDTSAIFQRSKILRTPNPPSSALSTANLCSRDRPHADPIGWSTTPTDPVETQWKALVTYPTCNLVALVDLPSGNIVDWVKVNPGPDGIALEQRPGEDPDCPVEDFCDGRTPPAEATPDGGATAADGSSAGDGSASDAGAPGTAAPSDLFVNPTGVRPSSMAIVPDGKRAYVGLTQASFVAAIDIQPNHLAIPSTGGSIKLHEGARGANVVRLSVDPFQAGPADGQLGGFVPAERNPQLQYLYVVARDGTVRVVNVSPRTQLLPETECDVNVDPRFVPVQSNDPLVPDRTDICWPTEPPDFAHRRPFARGPGITLPSIPRDVAFAELTNPDNPDHREVVLDGTYAFVLASSGAVYEVNIAPTLRTQQEVGTVASPSPLQEVQPLVNSLRDQNMITFTASLDPSIGPARVDLPPNVPPLGPQIAAINAFSPDDNATIVTPNVSIPTYVFFPQQVCTRATPNSLNTCDSALPMIQPQRQTWNIAWEGDLFGPSFSGQLKKADDNDQTPLTLTDGGVDFCQAGALPGDFVTLYGCTLDSQCGPLEVCRRSSTAPDTADALPINGLCVPNDSASAAQTKRLNDCAPLLNSLRRYEIVDAKSAPNMPSTLTLAPKIDEIPSGTLTKCQTAAPPSVGGDGPTGCNPDNYGTSNPYQCLDLDGSKHLRCVEICTQDSDCRSGRSCIPYKNAPFFTQAQVDEHNMHPDVFLKFCVEGAPITTDLIGKCQLNQLASYKVGVGESFLVQGTAPTPFVPGIVDPTTFSCVPNPQRMDRIPYFQTVNGVRTPIGQCPLFPYPPDPADPTMMKIPDLNQQLLDQVHTTPSPDPCLVQIQGSAADSSLRVLFQNREIRFMLTGFEQFPGNFDTITFDVHGGFLPDQVIIPTTIDINTPNRIVVGPVDSQGQAADLGATHEFPFMFVIDQRRLGSISAGVGATRGQVLRINPRRATTSDTNSLVPIYDDPVSTNNLWPIQ